MLSKTMSLIYDLVVHNMRTSRQHLFHNPHNRQLLYEQHLNVFNAVRRSDSAGARLAMIAHLEFVEAELLRDETSRSDTDSIS
jgi:GntR family transcriptional repressor for pyruvate dehydrogenase complex